MVLRMAGRHRAQRAPYWPHILRAMGLEDAIERERRRAKLTAVSGAAAFASVLLLWWIALEPLWRP